MLNKVKLYMVLISALILASCSQQEESVQQLNDTNAVDFGALENVSEESVGNLQSNLSAAVSLSGRTLYVCSSGSACGTGWTTGVDSTSSSTQGKSKSKPFKSIDYAVNLVSTSRQQKVR